MTDPSGAGAEQLACDWLQRQGLKLRARNYRSRRGEIDLIMQEGAQLVFVEVRYRRSNRFGSAAESVTPIKQARLVHTAAQYLQRQDTALACRFDVVAISGPDGKQIDWIRDAFQAQT